jgi:cytochrome P450
MTDTSARDGTVGHRPGEAANQWPSADPELDAIFAEVIGTPEGRKDPYGRYRRLREAAPVYASSLGFTVCTRYEECQWVLRDPRLGKDEGDRSEQVAQAYGHLEIFPKIQELMEDDRRSLLFLNPPDHTRLRSLVSKAFTPRTVERLRPEIVGLVDALIEPIVSDEEMERGLAAQMELDEYFRHLVALRRAEPRDDLLSQLIAVQEGSDRLSERELISTVILLFAAGFETTTNLIGNGLYALLTHPDQLSRLRKDVAEDGDGAIRTAVEELLRYDSPVQFDGRQAFEDLEIAGVPVKEGGEVITVLGAANRDPEHFSDPDELDLRRNEGPPLSFASGIHYCLGAALARAEGQVVFGRLLERFRSIELAGSTPEWKNRITLRGLASLEVVFS